MIGAVIIVFNAFWICPGTNTIKANNDSGNGQDVNGKGQLKKAFTFRPWPNAFLVQLTDASGKVLDASQIASYQNPGY